MRKWTLVPALLLVVGLAAAGCSDDAGSGAHASAPTNNGFLPDPGQNNDAIAIDPITPPHVGEDPTAVDYVVADVPVIYHLDVLGDAAIGLNYSNETTLQVVYTDDEDTPVRGGDVHFDFAGAHGDLELSDAVVATNRNGVSGVRLVTGRTTGVFKVVASADKAEPVEFTISVFPKDNAAYVVHTAYTGTAWPALVSVRLLDPSTTCSGLDPLNLPPALHQVDLLPRPDAIPDARFVTLPNGSDFTVVSLGLFDPAVPMAWGCNDQAPPIIDGFDQEVDVVMEELTPQVSGSYDIETRVDLVDALPEPWRTNIDIVGSIFTNPALALVNFMLGDEGVDGDGWFGDVLVPDVLWRPLLTDVLTQLVDAVLPPELRSIFDVGANVYQALTRFTLAGHILLDEPGADGELLLGQAHRYDRLRLRWTVGCTPADGPNCGLREFAMTDLGQLGFLSGEFSGRVATYDQASYLLVDRHSFSFNYGALALAIFEQLVFPQIFGPGVDTVAEALDSIVDCHGIADGLFDPVTDALFNGLVLDGCYSGLDALASVVLDSIAGAGNGVPSLTFGTLPVVQDWDVAMSGCRLHEPDPYTVDDAFRYFDRLGSLEQRCMWDAQLVTSQETRYLEADWFGVREP